MGEGRMQFGIANQPKTTDVMVDRARLAERTGFDLFGLTDTQVLMRELYTTMGAVAADTRRIELAPTVTNPVTRHPVVTASALCTIDEFTGGRAALGVASGDSAVHTVGEDPASFSEVAAFVRAFRALCAGERTEWNGHSVQLEWVRQAGSREVESIVAAGGPKTLAASGRVADRVLVSWGVNPPEIRDAVKRVHEGAREAGRAPDEVETWVHAWARFDDPSFVDDATIDNLTNSELAACAHLNFQFGGLDAKRVPERYRDPVRRLVEAYDSNQHMGMAEDGNREDDNRTLVERFGLADWLADRFLISGTPPECAEQLRAIEGLVDGVLFNPVGDVPRVPEAHVREFVRRMGEEVVPRV